ncbi:MAG: hypothetical protein Q8L79_15740 [Methylobacter sp.]|uniref:hypothetical protein n=1 Tax=Methylobacter sp. TaxID=2051955 RepID=UPI00272F0970|nr:hypothetical protein [Methylobacter sp.]MDP1666562.1 hypothetical protein [Methylobacter sp.]
MPENLKYNTNPNASELLLRSKGMDLESGWLGKLFGNSKTAPSNIACLCLLLLLVPGIALLFFAGTTSAGDYWNLITPIITLIFGYLFGKNI